MLLKNIIIRGVAAFSTQNYFICFPFFLKHAPSHAFLKVAGIFSNYLILPNTTNTTNTTCLYYPKDNKVLTRQTSNATK